MLLSLSAYPALKQGRGRGMNPWCDLYGKQRSCSHAAVLGNVAVFSLLCIWGKTEIRVAPGHRESESLAPKVGDEGRKVINILSMDYSLRHFHSLSGTRNTFIRHAGPSVVIPSSPGN